MEINQIKRLKARLQKKKARLLKIPAVQLIYRTAEGLGDIDATQRAAGIAYYAILSIFPLLLGLIAVFGFFLPSVDMQDKLLKFVGDNIPGATSILKQNIVSIIELRGAMGVLSVIILFWGASAMFRAVSLTINHAWDIRRYRNFFVRKTRELGMVFSIGVLFLFSIGASAIISILRGVLNMPVADLIIVNAGSRLAAFC